MQTNYNTLAGEEVGRVAALSDGIFAIAATILVLDFHTPEAADIHSEAELLRALTASAPRLQPWLLSSLTLGIFLAWPADAAQPARPFESRPRLAAFPFSRIRHRAAVLDQAVGRFPHISNGLSHLLGQHRCARRMPLRHMGVCRRSEAHSG